MGYFNRKFLLLYFFFLLVLLINSFHFVTLNLADVKPVFPLFPVWGSISVFWMAGLISAFLILIILKCQKSQGLLEFPIALFSFKAVLLCLFISAAGVTLHIYAKTSLPGYDQLACLSQIRFLWLDSNPSELLPLVRISSALGHIMVWFCVPGLVISSVNCIRAEGADKWGWLLLFGLFLVPGFLYSLFLGARGPMLALLIVSSVGVFISPLYTRFSWSGFRSVVSMLTLALIVVLGFAISVSNDRMQQCGFSSQNKTSEYLTGYEDELPVSVIGTSVVGGSGQVIFLYLNHGLFNFAKVYAGGEEKGNVVFRKSTWFLSRLGLLAAEPAYGPRRYGAGGIGLVGSIFHDYGERGVVLGGGYNRVFSWNFFSSARP